MVLTVLVVPVLMGAFLLLMERFETKLLGVAPPRDSDGELLGLNSTRPHTALDGDRRHLRMGDGGPPVTIPAA